MVLDLRTAYQEKIKENLSIIISAISETFNTDLSDLLETVSALDTEKRYSSALHSISVNLESAYSQKDFSKIVATLKSFQSLSPDSFYSENFSFDTVYGDFYDENLEDLLRTQDDVSEDYDGQQPEIRKLDDDELKKYLPYAESALEKIKEVDPDFRNEIDTHISRIKFFKGQLVTGISGLITFGTIYLRLPKPGYNPLSYFVEHFTHETSHYHLHSLMGFDPLILNSPEKRYPAPIRKDLRPLYGIFHATFVLSRIVRILSKLDQKHSGVFYEDLIKTRKQFELGLSTIRTYAELTERGKLVASSLEKTALA